MKILAIAVMMMGLGGVANAAGASEVAVMETTMTVRTVAVSPTVPTLVPGATQVLPGRTVLTVVNSSAVTVSCAGSANDVTNGHVFPIPAGGVISIAIREYSASLAKPISLYCLSASGTVNVAVIQGY